MNQTLNQFEKMVEDIAYLKDVENALLLEPISKGKWSIREIVGHLYFWDKYNLEIMVPKMKDRANLPPFPNHDEHNEEAITYIKEDSVDSIIRTFIETRKELLESLSKVSEDARFTIGNGKRQFSVESFIKIFVKHDIHHLKQINEKLKSVSI